MAKKARKKTKKRSKKASKKAKKTTTKSPPVKPSDVITAETTKKAVGIIEILKFGYSIDSLSKVKFKPEYIKKIEPHMALGMTMHDYARKIGVHRQTLEDWTRLHASLKDAIVKGLWTFVRDLAPKLISHMSEGRSFESFSHVCGRSRNWLYELARIDDEFKEAKERGYGSSLYQWEGLLIAQASGRLVRVSKETIRTNAKGEPLKNPTTGEILTDKTYVPAMGSDRALIFNMQCRFEEYRPDNKDSQQALYDELKEIMEAADKEDLKKRGGNL